MCCSEDGRYFACIVDKHIYVIDFDTKKHYSFKSGAKLTCIAMKSDATCICVGNNKGKIYYYYDFTSKSGATISTRHWHANPVKYLHFTRDNTFLLSGGKEAVVVLWHQATQQHSFISKVGNHIVNLSSSYDGSLISICMADNSIKIVRAQNYEIVQHIKGLLITDNSKFIQNSKFINH